MTALLSKQIAKFRTRLAAADRANLSIHAKIIYFNTFSLSLFYYSQTHRYFAPSLLQPLNQAMANFLLRRHWRLLVGLCRWLKIGPLLDPTVTQAFFCTSRGAMCAGSAQVTLVELRRSYYTGCKIRQLCRQSLCLDAACGKVIPPSPTNTRAPVLNKYNTVGTTGKTFFCTGKGAVCAERHKSP